MKLVIAAACLAASLSLATGAMADTQTIATLQQPLAKSTNFILRGVMWQCDGDTCAAMAPEQTIGVDQCHGVARKAGPIAAFKNDAMTLQPTALEKCNEGVAPKAPVTASR